MRAESLSTLWRREKDRAHVRAFRGYGTQHTHACEAAFGPASKENGFGCDNIAVRHDGLLTEHLCDVPTSQERNTFETFFLRDETRFRPSAMNPNFMRQTNERRTTSAHLQQNEWETRHAL
jgi:hypothetical protein